MAAPSSPRHTQRRGIKQPERLPAGNGRDSVDSELVNLGWRRARMRRADAWRRRWSAAADAVHLDAARSKAGAVLIRCDPEWRAELLVYPHAFANCANRFADRRNSQRSLLMLQLSWLVRCRTAVGHSADLPSARTDVTRCGGLLCACRKEACVLRHKRDSRRDSQHFPDQRRTGLWPSHLRTNWAWPCRLGG